MNFQSEIDQKLRILWFFSQNTLSRIDENFEETDCVRVFLRISPGILSHIENDSA